MCFEDGIWLPEDDFAISSRVVRVPRFLSADDIGAIHRAAHEVKRTVGSHVRTLPVDIEGMGRGAGRTPPWTTTYLQSLGLNRRHLAPLMERIESKAVEVDGEHWGVLPDR